MPGCTHRVSIGTAETVRAGFAAPPSLARRMIRHEPSIVTVLFQPGFLGDHRRNRAGLYGSPCLPFGGREAILGAKFGGLPHIGGGGDILVSESQHRVIRLVSTRLCNSESDACHK